MEDDAKVQDDVKVFGFWVYLMTDLVIFAVLFATFAVMRDSTFGGPAGHDLFELPTALTETLILLTSSFTCGIAMIGVHKQNKKSALFWFLITFALGVAFLVLELLEFSHFIQLGAGWQRSAFLSAFFTLVGTHGLHITCGLLWMLVAMYSIMLRPITPFSVSWMLRMALFWHFLDFVWIFIFTFVYGMGYLT